MSGASSACTHHEWQEVAQHRVPARDLQHMDELSVTVPPLLLDHMCLPATGMRVFSIVPFSSENVQLPVHMGRSADDTDVVPGSLHHLGMTRSASGAIRVGSPQR